MLSPKSIAAFGQSMAPIGTGPGEYQKQFAVRPKVGTGDSIFAGKTQAEQNQGILKWRTDHITSKDGTAEAARAEEELRNAASTGSTPPGDGTAPKIEFHADGQFTDANYVPPGSSGPKPFKNIGHYANQVLDSMIIYNRKGYPMQETRKFLRFDKKALDILNKFGYFYTGD